MTRVGSPDEIKVLESPHLVLSAAAIAALKQWVFQPATLNGEPVDVKSSFTIHFRLDEKTKDPVVK